MDTENLVKGRGGSADPWGKDGVWNDARSNVCLLELKIGSSLHSPCHDQFLTDYT